jgi:K+-transporting ATPase ATPase C chain
MTGTAIRAHGRPAIVLLLLLTAVTGVLYPLLVTGIAQVVFPLQANGSLIQLDGKPVGSRLIGQQFDDPKYFWSRPSATLPHPYNAGASSGSNLGPLNPTLLTVARTRVEALRSADPGNQAPIPVDLVTASASGLDPDVTPAAALYQVSRVARARGIDPTLVRHLVESHIQERQFGLLGEPRVNVLELNLALDALAHPDPPHLR